MKECLHSLSQYCTVEIHIKLWLTAQPIAYSNQKFKMVQMEPANTGSSASNL